MTGLQRRYGRCKKTLTSTNTLDWTEGHPTPALGMGHSMNSILTKKQENTQMNRKLHAICAWVYAKS
jgi:hypothetical protein